MGPYSFDIVGVDEQERRVAWLPLTLLALGSLTAGLYLSHRSLDQPLEVQKPARAPAPAPAKVRKERTSSSPQVRKKAVASQPKIQVQTPAMEKSAPPSGMQVAALADRKKTLRIRPGRVAYFRCDGATLRKGAFPCPRDRNVEFAVWRTLKALPSCSQGSLAPGVGELELDFVRHHPPVLRMRSSKAATPEQSKATGSDTLPLRSEELQKCVGEAFSGLKQHVGASRLVISFRFEVFEALR